MANVGEVSAAISEDVKNKLTPTGLAQIQKMAQNMDAKISAVYASPMRRTIESAKVFIGAGHPQTPLLIDDRLREIDYGIYTDDRDNPEMAKIAAQQIAGDYEIRFGGGENKREILTRFFDFINDCYKQHQYDNIVVFSHGRAISMVEAEFCRINKIQKKHIHTDNGTVKEIEVGQEGIERVVEHLKI